MPLDDRLRAGLTRDDAYRPAHQDEVLADLVARANRRRRVRGLAIGAAAAVVLLVVAAAVPWAARVARSDDPVVVTSTTEQTNIIDDWRPPDCTSPVDGDTWRTGVIPRADRLAALDGTGLEGAGPLVYTRAAMRQAFSEAEFVQNNFTGKVKSHGLGSSAVLPAGTFRVLGPNVVITFADGGGRAVFRWDKPADNALKLTFVSTTAPDMYGAPAEVFLRMWSAARFINP
jgi:hypothetical protein